LRKKPPWIDEKTACRPAGGRKDKERGGKDMNEFAVSVKGADRSKRVTYEQVNKCAGCWVETNGKSLRRYVAKPSFHFELKGDRREIERRCCSLAKKFRQEGIIVACHDSRAKGSGVFTLKLSDATGDAAMEAIAQHFVDAGFHWVSGSLYKPEFRFVAFSRDEMAIVRRAVKTLPKAFRPVLNFRKAKTRHIDESEYDAVIADRADDDKVRADVFIMGIPKRKEK